MCVLVFFWGVRGERRGEEGREGRERGGGRGVETNDSFRRQFTPSCKVSKKSVVVQDHNTFIHERLSSTLVANVARVALSQTNFGWWMSLSTQRCCREWASFAAQFLDIWNSFVFGCNHRNSRSKSGVCGEVRTSFLRVGALVSACTFPRPFVVVDSNQFTQQGGRAQI